MRIRFNKIKKETCPLFLKEHEIKIIFILKTNWTNYNNLIGWYPRTPEIIMEVEKNSKMKRFPIYVPEGK